MSLGSGEGLGLTAHDLPTRKTMLCGNQETPILLVIDHFAKTAATGHQNEDYI